MEIKVGDKIKVLSVGRSDGYKNNSDILVGKIGDVIYVYDRGRNPADFRGQIVFDDKTFRIKDSGAEEDGYYEFIGIEVELYKE